jgi:hypothetical protein
MLCVGGELSCVGKPRLLIGVTLLSSSVSHSGRLSRQKYEILRDAFYLPLFAKAGFIPNLRRILDICASIDSTKFPHGACARGVMP